MHTAMRALPRQGGLLEEDLYDMPKGFEAKDVLATGSDLWNEQLKLPAEERRYGAGKDLALRSEPAQRTATRTTDGALYAVASRC